MAGLAGCPAGDTSAPSTTGTPGQTSTPSVDPEALQARTREIVGRLVDGEFETIVAEYDFTAEVESQLDAATLESAWQGQTGSLGQFIEIETVEYARSQGFHVTDAVVRFTGGDQVVRVAYTDAGEIAGLRFLGSQADYSPPDYVDRSAFTELERSVTATDACSLPATLSMPQGDGGVPGVVLVHGSGPNDMDETVGPNKPFRDLAWGLASRGIAVLRYDKRTHACDVDLASLTLDSKITDDALAALDVLREHDRVGTTATAAVGHSIGAMVVPRLLERDETIAAGAMLAAPARPVPELIREQSEYLVSLDGTVTEAESARRASIERAVEQVQSLDIPRGEVVLNLGGRPFWRTLGEYDQVATAQRLDRPLWIAQGGRDYQVSLERDFRRWEDALADRETVRLVAYPDLNHLFVSGDGPSTPAEYLQPGNVAAAVVSDLAGWIHEVTET